MPQKTNPDALSPRPIEAYKDPCAFEYKGRCIRRYAACACEPARPYMHLCSDCPPAGYPTSKTRCDACPLKETSNAKR
jgi:hypothetical protein